MHSEESLAELAREIAAQGVDEETAWHYAALIGDTPLIDGNEVVVREGTREIARLKPLRCLGMLP